MPVHANTRRLTANESLQRWTVVAVIVTTTLALKVNALDSGLPKMAFLVLGASFIAALYLTEVLSSGTILLPTRESMLAAFLGLIAAISLSFSNYPHYGWPAFGFFASCLVMFFAGTRLFQQKPTVNRLITIIALVAVIVCAIAFLQVTVLDHMGIDFYISRTGRVLSTLGNSTFLSAWIILVFPIILAQTLATRRRRFLRALLLGALLVALILTKTRSSISAFAIAIPLFFILLRKTRKEVVFIGIGLVAVGIAAILLLAPDIVTRFETTFRFDRTSSFARRTYFWEAGKRAVTDAPLVGHGIGSFEAITPSHRSPDYWIVQSEDIVPHAHNEALELAVEFGLLGTLPFLVFFVLVLARGWRAIKQEGDWNRIMATGLVVSLVAVALDNLISVSIRQPPVGALAWLFAGLLCSPLFGSQNGGAWRGSFPSQRFLRWVPMFCWIIFAFFYARFELAVMRSDTHTMEAMLANVKGAHQTTLAEYEEATRIDPGNLLAQSSKALEYLKADKPEDCLQTIVTLQTVSPNYPKSHLMQAIALMKTGRLQEALRAIHEEQKLRDHPESFYIEAIIHQALRDTLSERAALVNLLKRDINGKVLLQIDYAVGKLLAFSSTRGQLVSLRGILRELRTTFPNQRAIVQALEEVDRRIAPQPAGGKL